MHPFSYLLEALDEQPQNTVRLAKELNKLARAEMGDADGEAFSDPLLMQRLLKVASRYEADLNTFEWLLRSAVSISSRFHIDPDSLYEMLSRHRDSTSARIRAIAASRLPLMPQFGSLPERWSYLMQIARQAPRSETITMFRFAVEANWEEMPPLVREQAAAVLRAHIEKTTLPEDTAELYRNTIRKLAP